MTGKSFRKSFLFFLISCSLAGKEQEFCDRYFSRIQQEQEDVEQCCADDSDVCKQARFEVEVRWYQYWILCPQKVSGKCYSKTDVIFVLDRSGSISIAEYNKMRDFLIELGEKLQFGVKNENGEVIGQGAVCTFSEDSVVRITLIESREPGQFASVVKKMPGPLRSGRTKMDKGLDQAVKKIAIPGAGLRQDDPDVSKILVVITDGRQTKYSTRRGYRPVGEAVDPFYNKSFKVFVIGVGPGIDKAEIESMVTGEKENALFLSSYQELKKNLDFFLEKLCP